MTGAPGVMALDDGGGPDFTRLRRERRARCLAEMERRDVDLLLLSRDANVRYASGARRLWHAGSRPFSAGCAVVRQTGEVHLTGIHAEGVPPEISREQLHPTSWSPATSAARLAGITGVSSARRVATDAMTAGFARLLPEIAPRAAWRDGEELMRRVRTPKTRDEIACLRTAVALCESSLQQVIDHLRAGARERDLAGVFAEAAAARGVTTPAHAGSFCALPARARADGRIPLRQLPGERPLADGDLVSLDGGLLYAGYEGGLARTWPCPTDASPGPAQRALYRRWRTVMDALLDACRAGRPCSDLRAAHLRSGEPLPPIPLAHGIGLGLEPPLAGAGVDPEIESRCTLAADGAVSLQTCVWEPGVGGFFGRESVLIRSDGPEILSTLEAGPLST